LSLLKKPQKKYFDEEDPIGKTLQINASLNCTVTGILEEMPQNSHFRYDLLASLVKGRDDFWGWY